MTCLASEVFQDRPQELLSHRIEDIASGPHDSRANLGERLVCLSVRILASPLIAYTRWRSRKQLHTYFDAVDLHTLSDIGLLRNHVRPVADPGDNSDRRHAA